MRDPNANESTAGIALVLFAIGAACAGAVAEGVAATVLAALAALAPIAWVFVRSRRPKFDDTSTTRELTTGPRTRLTMQPATQLFAARHTTAFANVQPTTSSSADSRPAIPTTTTLVLVPMRPPLSLELSTR